MKKMDAVQAGSLLDSDGTNGEVCAKSIWNCCSGHRSFDIFVHRSSRITSSPPPLALVMGSITLLLQSAEDDYTDKLKAVHWS